MESFSEKAQLAKHAAGIRGGPFLKNPVVPPKRDIVEGLPSTVLEKLKHTGIKQGTPIDVWVSRRSNSNL